MHKHPDIRLHIQIYIHILPVIQRRLETSFIFLFMLIIKSIRNHHAIQQNKYITRVGSFMYLLGDIKYITLFASVLQRRDLRPLINKRGPSNQRNPAVGVLPAVGFWFYGVTACTAAPSGRPSRRLRIRSGGSRRGPFPACGPGPPVPGRAG